jgi:hypothetical protein
MSKYKELRLNPPKLNIKKGAREVIFTTISVMCDNKHTISFRKNDNGDFKMSGMGYALSNWQFGYREGGIEPYQIEWEADNENWVDVIDMINSGTEVIKGVVSR